LTLIFDNGTIRWEGEAMRQFGEVIATKDREAQVRVVQHSACANCDHRCGLAYEMKDIQVSARNDIGATPGESVVLEMCHTVVLRAALWAYVFPLVFLFTGVVAGVMVWESELTGLLLGVGMLVLSYLVIRHVVEPRLKQRERYQLVIVQRANNLECVGRNI
jgi:positive regulator of sigma E activity